MLTKEIKTKVSINNITLIKPAHVGFLTVIKRSHVDSVSASSEQVVRVYE